MPAKIKDRPYVLVIICRQLKIVALTWEIQKFATLGVNRFDYVSNNMQVELLVEI